MFAITDQAVVFSVHFWFLGDSIVFIIAAEIQHISVLETVINNKMWDEIRG